MAGEPGIPNVDCFGSGSEEEAIDRAIANIVLSETIEDDSHVSSIPSIVDVNQEAPVEHQVLDEPGVSGEAAAQVSIEVTQPVVIDNRIIERLLDPLRTPIQLFRLCDQLLFSGNLKHWEVRFHWMRSMKRNVANCSWNDEKEVYEIKLSQFLLANVSREEFLRILIHEMIHAVIMISGGSSDRSFHGRVFDQHSNRINQLTGLNISSNHYTPPTELTSPENECESPSKSPQVAEPGCSTTGGKRKKKVTPVKGTQDIRKFMTPTKKVKAEEDSIATSSPSFCASNNNNLVASSSSTVPIKQHVEQRQPNQDDKPVAAPIHPQPFVDQVVYFSPDQEDDNESRPWIPSDRESDSDNDLVWSPRTEPPSSPVIEQNGADENHSAYPPAAEDDTDYEEFKSTKSSSSASAAARNLFSNGMNGNVKKE